MSNRPPLTCDVPAGEQCGLLVFRVIMSNRSAAIVGRTLLARTDAAEAVTESYPLSSSTRQSATTGITTKRNR
jgi:hypothetical protein